MAEFAAAPVLDLLSNRPVPDAVPVRREYMLNAITTGAFPIVTGAYERKRRLAAGDSAGGPFSEPKSWPTLLADADSGSAHPGTIGGCAALRWVERDVGHQRRLPGRCAAWRTMFATGNFRHAPRFAWRPRPLMMERWQGARPTCRRIAAVGGACDCIRSCPWTVELRRKIDETGLMIRMLLVG